LEKAFLLKGREEKFKFPPFGICVWGGPFRKNPGVSRWATRFGFPRFRLGNGQGNNLPPLVNYSGKLFLTKAPALKVPGEFFSPLF